MRRILLLAALLTATIPASAQGCSQCRDNAAATPPQTQAGYRHAIILLVVTAGSIFAGSVLMLRRSR